MRSLGLTMLIGAAANGALLEIGVLDIDDDPRGHPRDAIAAGVLPVPRRRVMPMGHTDEEAERRNASRSLPRNSPRGRHGARTDDLRGIADAAQSVRDDEARLLQAVKTARAHGRSWNQVAVALGVARPGARQRFADKVRGARAVSGGRGSLA